MIHSIINNFEKEKTLCTSSCIHDRIVSNKSETVDDYFNHTIFSSSGIRRVFADNRDELSTVSSISVLDFILTYSAVKSYLDFLGKNDFVTTKNILSSSIMYQL